MDRRHQRSSPFVLGLTGAIGCGKTTVGDILLELGALERIDADRVVHRLMEPGTEVTAQVARAFGQHVLLPDAGVNRQALGRIVFGDPAKLRRLEEITHPAVRREIRRRIESLAGTEGVVVVDAVKLLESDLLPLTDAVWMVQCAPDQQLLRLTQTRNMTAEDAAARIRAQPTFHHPAVTRVIQNNQTLMKLRENVAEAWQELPTPEE